MSRQTPNDPATAAEVDARPVAAPTILVPVDDGEPSRWAIAVAADLARATSARVLLLHAVNVAVHMAYEPFVSEDVYRGLREHGTAVLGAARALLPADVPTDALLREGDAPHEIVTAARTCDASLIVMGTRGRGPVGRLLLGSTAADVVRKAPCPVLTVGHEPVRPITARPRQESAEPVSKV
jgi:nucleotide-binding universal stress UspA family protein